MRALVAVALAVLAVPFVAGCRNPEYVRGDDDPALDQAPMSLKLDRKDLDRLYEDNVRQLLDSAVAKEWERSAAMGTPAVVAIFPFRNDTSEHIGGGLAALLSRLETDLVNRTSVTVVSHESQPELVAEINRQQSGAFDPAKIARLGRQLGAGWFVTGKVSDVAERDDDARRVQYFLFLQVLQVETGAVRFQSESQLTKGLR